MVKTTKRNDYGIFIEKFVSISQNRILTKKIRRRRRREKLANQHKLKRKWPEYLERNEEETIYVEMTSDLENVAVPTFFFVRSFL